MKKKKKKVKFVWTRENFSETFGELISVTPGSLRFLLFCFVLFCFLISYFLFLISDFWFLISDFWFLISSWEWIRKFSFPFTFDLSLKSHTLSSLGFTFFVMLLLEKQNLCVLSLQFFKQAGLVVRVRGIFSKKEGEREKKKIQNLLISMSCFP